MSVALEQNPSETVGSDARRPSQPGSNGSSEKKIKSPAPSTELFPDSYEQAIEKTKIYICILHANQDASNQIFNENADFITEALEDCGYDTATQLKRMRFSHKVDLNTFLHDVKTTDFFGASAVLLFWLGETDKEGSNAMISLRNDVYDIRDLWKPFVAADHLHGKPKINMFFTYLPPPSSIQTDSCVNIKKPKDLYEPPREADVLIIFQKTDMRKANDASSYVKSFASNMRQLGQQYHLGNLACINTKTDPRQGQHHPIVVSTLTRKFFIQPSEHRGIHLELDNITKGIQLNLKMMLQGGKKTATGPRRSATAPPATPRFHFKDLPENSGTEVDAPPRAATPTPPKPSRPRLPSQTKSIHSKPKWKN